MYLYVMSDLLNKKQDSVSQEQKSADVAAKTAAEIRKAQRYCFFVVFMVMAVYWLFRIRLMIALISAIVTSPSPLMSPMIPPSPGVWL